MSVKPVCWCSMEGRFSGSRVGIRRQICAFRAGGHERDRGERGGTKLSGQVRAGRRWWYCSADLTGSCFVRSGCLCPIPNLAPRTGCGGFAGEVLLEARRAGNRGRDNGLASTFTSLVSAATKLMRTRRVGTSTLPPAHPCIPRPVSQDGRTASQSGDLDWRSSHVASRHSGHGHTFTSLDLGCDLTPTRRWESLDSSCTGEAMQHC